VRPLLGIWRAEILEYNQGLEVPAHLDASNYDTRFFRNRVRQELIPFLQSYNPQLKQAIWRMANILSEDYAILGQVVAAAEEESVVERGDGYVAFNSAILESQPHGVQRHLLRRAIAQLRPGLRDVDYEAVERGLSFLRNPSSSRRMDLISGLGLELESGRLWLATWEADLPGGGWPEVPEGAEIELGVPGNIPLSGGWLLRAEHVPAAALAHAQALSDADPFQAWIDPAGLELPLTIRARRPGDRIRPLGMQGHSLKLSDFMINQKLPRRARSRWPLVFSGEEIVWIPGFRLADPLRLKQEGQAAVRLQLGKT
jgi:tRNA(Ile)-lysidine synthase